VHLEIRILEVRLHQKVFKRVHTGNGHKHNPQDCIKQIILSIFGNAMLMHIHCFFLIFIPVSIGQHIIFFLILKDHFYKRVISNFQDIFLLAIVEKYDIGLPLFACCMSNQPVVLIVELKNSCSTIFTFQDKRLVIRVNDYLKPV